MSYQFIDDENYRIGNLTKLGEQDAGSSFPKFSPRPTPISISGQQLKMIGVKDFATYLKKNPHNFPKDRTIYLFKIDKQTNQYIRVDEGNPIIKTDNTKRGNLPLPDRNNHAIPIQPGNDNNSVLSDMFENRVRDLQEELRQKNYQLEDMQKRMIDKDEAIAELKAKFRVLEIENDKLQGAVEGYINKYGSQNGLSDGGAGGLMDKLLPIVDKIASSQQGADALGAIMGWVAGKINPGQVVAQPQIQAPQPQSAITQNPFVNGGVPVNGQGGNIVNI